VLDEFMFSLFISYEFIPIFHMCNYTLHVSILVHTPATVMMCKLKRSIQLVISHVWATRSQRHEESVEVKLANYSIGARKADAML